MAGLESGAAQCEAQYVAQFLHQVHIERLAGLLRQIFEIPLVFFRQNDRRDSRPNGTEHLLLDPADRQHAATQRDLARHRDSAETSAVAIVTPAEGPSFGIAPAGTCT